MKKERKKESRASIHVSVSMIEFMDLTLFQCAKSMTAPLPETRVWRFNRSRQAPRKRRCATASGVEETRKVDTVDTEIVQDGVFPSHEKGLVAANRGSWLFIVATGKGVGPQMVICSDDIEQE
jgi:hypothetical protein